MENSITCHIGLKSKNWVEKVVVERIRFSALTMAHNRPSYNIKIYLLVAIARGLGLRPLPVLQERSPRYNTIPQDPDYVLHLKKPDTHRFGIARCGYAGIRVWSVYKKEGLDLGLVEQKSSDNCM